MRLLTGRGRTEWSCGRWSWGGAAGTHKCEERRTVDNVSLLRLACCCKVTSTWMTPVPCESGSSAFPTTAPSLRLRSVTRMACPGVEEVTSRSPTRIGPFSALTLRTYVHKRPFCPFSAERHVLFRPFRRGHSCPPTHDPSSICTGPAGHSV